MVQTSYARWPLASALNVGSNRFLQGMARVSWTLGNQTANALLTHSALFFANACRVTGCPPAAWEANEISRLAVSCTSDSELRRVSSRFLFILIVGEVELEGQGMWGRMMIEQTVDQTHDLGENVLCFWDCGFFVACMLVWALSLSCCGCCGCRRAMRAPMRASVGARCVGWDPATRVPPRLIAV